MAIYRDSTELTPHGGSSEIENVYFGSTRVYQKSTPPPPQLPVAAAGSVTLNEEDETPSPGQTQRLSALDFGGTYDDLSYNWEITSGTGTLDSTTGQSVNYTHPDDDTNTRVRVTVTFSGTGTVARAGTTATNSASQLFQ